MGARGRILLVIGACALAAGLTGCGRESAPAPALGEVRWDSFPVPLQADEAFFRDREAERDLLDAIAFWESKAGKRLFSLSSWPKGRAVFEGAPDSPSQIHGNALVFQHPWPFESQIAGKTVSLARNNSIQKAAIYLNAQTPLCHGQCTGQNTLTSRRKLLAHELGHFLGLPHVSERGNLMYPEILPGGSLDQLTVNQELLERLTR